MKRGGRNANAQSRHEKIGLSGAERDQRRGTAHQKGLNTWSKLSSMEKLIEARKSKGSLKQKKGERMKHPIATLTRADAPAGKNGGESEVSWKLN